MIGVQLTITSAQAMIEEVVPIQNHGSAFIKKPAPGTGLWTSTWDAEEKTSDWVEWCSGENFGTPYSDNWFLLTPKSDVKLYIIDGAGDLTRLLKEYEWIDPFYRNRLDERFMRRFATGIDFERLAQEYDGLHLTHRGNNQLHLNIMGDHDLNAWDVESTVWFRWCFSKVEKIATPVQPQEVTA